MAEMELYIDDNVVIPEKIMRMTNEERQREIARLEAEALAEKNRLIESGVKLPKL